MNYSKTVLLPIKVSPTDYCWDGKVSCQYFDNTGGHPQCELGVGFYPENNKKNGYPLKPNGCKNLQEVKG